ncbi:MAG: universal stress protein [Bdellovibrionales bacterium]|nr:universal stress protein [Bdellovibrionales bacterium]
MFSMAKILLPVDFSQRSVGAARYAEALSEQYGAEVSMVHVIPPPHYEFASMEAGSTALAELYVNRKAALEEECRNFLQEELPRFNPNRVLLEGDPAREVVQMAHDGGYNLIVMPTHGYGPFRRFILGSVTAKVLHDADCPVWTGVHLEDAPPVEAIHFDTVLAAVDLGTQSELALAWAAQFACNAKAKLVVVHATPNLEGRTGEYFDPDWRRYLAQQAEQGVADLQMRVGTKAETLIEPGDPPHVVEGAARRFGASVVVIGRGSASGVFGRLRANAYSIIRQSPCPVVSV